MFKKHNLYKCDTMLIKDTVKRVHLVSKACIDTDIEAQNFSIELLTVIHQLNQKFQFVSPTTLLEFTQNFTELKTTHFSNITKNKLSKQLKVGC